MLNKFDGSVSF